MQTAILLENAQIWAQMTDENRHSDYKNKLTLIY